MKTNLRGSANRSLGIFALFAALTGWQFQAVIFAQEQPVIIDASPQQLPPTPTPAEPPERKPDEKPASAAATQPLGTTQPSTPAGAASPTTQPTGPTTGPAASVALPEEFSVLKT